MSIEQPDVTICVLLYGDYPDLAHRCVISLVPLVGLVDLRIGANAVSKATREGLSSLGIPLYCDSKDNIKKYPMMRKLFAWDTDPIQTEWVMWFDDDSFIKEDASKWITQALEAGQDCDMVGHVWWQRLAGRQHEWIRAQSWYNDQRVDLRHMVKFATGGWWLARTEILKRFNWPMPQLLHRGGDVMLGELCRQQNIILRDWHEGVAVNADAQGNDSKAKRRGFNSDPIGF